MSQNGHDIKIFERIFIERNIPFFYNDLKTDKFHPRCFSFLFKAIDVRTLPAVIISRPGQDVHTFETHQLEELKDFVKKLKLF